MASLPNNVSDSVKRLNPHLYGPAPDCLPSRPESEQAVRHDALGPPPREEENPSRCVVRIISYRCGTLLDPDNLCGGTKFFTDSLRKFGVIKGDSPEDIELQVAQVRVKHRRDERTEITVTDLKPSDP